MKRNGVFIVLCTVHREKTPSLVIWKSGNFLCHGCHYRGRIEDDPTLQEKVARLRWQCESSLWLFPEESPSKVR